MREEISSQILTQTSDNIQKLFDVSIRIDERIKLIHSQQESLDRRFEELTKRQIETLQKIAVLESKDKMDKDMVEKLDKCEGSVVEIDKRVTKAEHDSTRHNDRWNKVGTLVIQLVWVIL